MLDLSNKDKTPLGQMKWNVYTAMFSAYMRGETIQYWSGANETWSTVAPGWIKSIAYRVKPSPGSAADHLMHSPQSIGRSQARFCH